MEPGEKEMRKAFEDLTTRNVKVVTEFSQETRRMFRELEVKVKLLENYITTQNSVIAELRMQLSSIQAKVYAGGS